MQPIDQSDDPLQPQPYGQSLQQGRDQTRPASGFDIGKLSDGWNSWIDKPNNRAALMQFGIAMLQPIGMGETGVSHFANAVGAAGEAHQRVTTQEQQARKEDTAATLREATASARETSANAAEIRAGLSGQIADQRRQLADQNSDIKAANAYQQYVRDTQKANTDPLRTTPPDAILGPDEWRAKMGIHPGSAGSGTPGGKQPWTNLQRDPKIVSAITFVRQKVATGKPEDIQRARQYIETVIAPQVEPSDLAHVYQTFGIPPR